MWDVDLDAAEAVAAELGDALAFAVDVADESSVEAGFDALGSVSVRFVQE